MFLPKGIRNVVRNERAIQKTNGVIPIIKPRSRLICMGAAGKQFLRAKAYNRQAEESACAIFSNQRYLLCSQACGRGGKR